DLDDPHPIREERADRGADLPPRGGRPVGAVAGTFHATRDAGIDFEEIANPTYRQLGLPVPARALSRRADGRTWVDPGERGHAARGAPPPPAVASSVAWCSPISHPPPRDRRGYLLVAPPPRAGNGLYSGE